MTKNLVFFQMQITTWRWQLFRHTNLISSNNSPYLRSWKCFLKNWQFYFTKSSIFISLCAASPFAGSQSMTWRVIQERALRCCYENKTRTNTAVAGSVKNWQVLRFSIQWNWQEIESSNNTGANELRRIKEQL